MSNKDIFKVDLQIPHILVLALEYVHERKNQPDQEETKELPVIDNERKNE